MHGGPPGAAGVHRAGGGSVQVHDGRQTGRAVMHLLVDAIGPADQDRDGRRFVGYAEEMLIPVEVYPIGV
ncbi:hypothetical protein Q0Z83_038980 [Actinoplanes sichuanensis]|nr:hypothetical protein Q0Z83_038980 [Actinoplanes sichuanensis]